MNQKFVFVLCFIISSCSSTPPQSVMSGRQKDEIRTALYKGNHNEFMKLLSAYPTLSNYDRFDFLKASLANGCYPDEVRLILSKNSSPFEEKLKGTYGKKNFAERFQSLSQSPDSGYEQRGDIDGPGIIITSLAGKQLCFEALELIQGKVSSSDWAKAVYIPIDDYKKTIGTNEKPMVDVLFENFTSIGGGNDERVQRFLNTGKVIGSRVKIDCEKKIAESCEAKRHLLVMKQKMDEEVKEDEYWDGPEGTLSKACDVYRQLQNQQAYIDHQKEIGRNSGVVNMKVLHDAGSMVVYFKNQLEPLKAKYRKQTGKNFEIQNCKN